MIVRKILQQNIVTFVKRKCYKKIARYKANAIKNSNTLWRVRNHAITK